MHVDQLFDARYIKVQQAIDIVVQRLVNAGLGKDVIRSNTLTLGEEALMLASLAACMDTPTGLNKRFGYFSMSNFFCTWCK